MSVSVAHGRALGVAGERAKDARSAREHARVFDARAVAHEPCERLALLDLGRTEDGNDHGRIREIGRHVAVDEVDLLAQSRCQVLLACRLHVVTVTDDLCELRAHHLREPALAA